MRKTRYQKRQDRVWMLRTITLIIVVLGFAAITFYINSTGHKAPWQF